MSRAPHDTCILVATCRRYEYVVPAFVTLLQRYWPQRRLPLYVSSDGDLAGLDPDVRRLPRPDDPGFIESWLFALQRLDHECVLVMQEDFLVEAPVDDGLVESYCRVLAAHDDVGCIRLMPFPPPLEAPREIDGVPLGEIRRSDPYCFSWQAAIWKRRVLIRFLEQRLARGDQALAELRARQPGLAAADLDHRVPRPPPHAYHAYNPEHHGEELFDLFPGIRLLGFVPRELRPLRAMLSCPLPYRVTAIVGGELTFPAQQLLAREGIAVNAAARESRSRFVARRLRWQLARGYWDARVRLGAVRRRLLRRSLSPGR